MDSVKKENEAWTVYRELAKKAAVEAGIQFDAAGWMIIEQAFRSGHQLGMAQYTGVYRDACRQCGDMHEVISGVPESALYCRRCAAHLRGLNVI